MPDEAAPERREVGVLIVDLSGFTPFVEMAEPEEFFNNPRSDRTKLFLGQILNH